MRAFIRFAHHERGIRPSLTAETLDAVDRWEPEYQAAIRSDRPQGPMAILAAMGALAPDGAGDLSKEATAVGVREGRGGRKRPTPKAPPQIAEEVTASVVLGRAEYEPGWRWSRDVAGDEIGTTLCQASHLGIVLEGENKVTMTDGTVYMLRPGDVFEIGPGHESEVVGDARYVSIHLQEIEQYLEKT